MVTQKSKEDLLRDALLHVKKKYHCHERKLFLFEESWLRRVTEAAEEPVKQTHST